MRVLKTDRITSLTYLCPGFYYDNGYECEPSEAGEVFEFTGTYGGNTLTFVTYPEAEVLSPFPKEENRWWGMPLFHEGELYVPEVDFGKGTYRIHRGLPKGRFSPILTLDLGHLDLYNLAPTFQPLTVASQDAETLKVYYPKKVTIPMEPNESFVLVEKDRYYFVAWYEEGGRYWETVKVRDEKGRVLWEERGTLLSMPDGYWRISQE